MPYLDVENCQIYYETRGETGDWVTLINGHTRSHTDFKLFAKKLNEAGYRCLLFDNRGAGKTICNTDFSLEDISDDLMQLWKNLSISDSHLIGISMGGIIAQLHTIKHEEYVKSLTLISTTSSRKWICDIGNQAWVADENEVYKKLSFYFAPEFLEKNELLVKAMCKQIAKGLEDFDLQNGYRRQKQAMNHLQMDPGQYYIEKPTHIIHGTLDRVIDVKAALEIASQIPGSKLTLAENAGHLLLAEWAKKLYASTIDFINRVEHR